VTSTCDRCGDPVENKNNVGHFRDHCWECIEAIAAEEEASHPDRCDDLDCMLCLTR